LNGLTLKNIPGGLPIDASVFNENVSLKTKIINLMNLALELTLIFFQYFIVGEEVHLSG